MKLNKFDKKDIKTENINKKKKQGYSNYCNNVDIKDEAKNKIENGNSDSNKKKQINENNNNKSKQINENNNNKNKQINENNNNKNKQTNENNNNMSGQTNENANNKNKKSDESSYKFGNKLKCLINKTKNGLATVKVRLFLTINLTIILIVLFIILVNNFALENFYSFNKTQKLKEVYNKINEYYNNPNSDKDLEEKLEQISVKNNFDILIKDDNGISVYTTNSNFNASSSEFDFIFSDLPRGKQIENTENYTIEKQLDEKKRNFIHNAFWKA